MAQLKQKRNAGPGTRARRKRVWMIRAAMQGSPGSMGAKPAKLSTKCAEGYASSAGHDRQRNALTGGDPAEEGKEFAAA
jgi:hypothetical protein